MDLSCAEYAVLPGSSVTCLRGLDGGQNSDHLAAGFSGRRFWYAICRVFMPGTMLHVYVALAPVCCIWRAMLIGIGAVGIYRQAENCRMDRIE